MFAVQDEITEAIVAAIEPQLYAAENFRARRKQPDNMDAWDLVMRALSHYWRVTRQDILVAQALLEKAIAIDPNYGQALGVLAATHTFSAHIGWAETATTLPIAERAALAAIRADNEDPWAHYALGNVYLFRRRFDDSLSEFELALRLNPNFSLAQGYYGLTLSYCGRWEEGDLAARRALRLSPRDPFSAIYCGIAAYAQFLGRNYDEAMRLAGDGYSATRRFCRRLPRAHCRRWHGRPERCRQSRIAGASPCAAQHFARLDRKPNADQAGCRPRALSGGVSPCRTGMTIAPPSYPSPLPAKPRGHLTTENSERLPGLYLPILPDIDVRFDRPAPSPTAEATRFIDPRRTSPTANTPGMLVSKLIGCRPKDHLRKLTSCPVTMKSFEVRCTAEPNQSVFGAAPISTKSTVAGMRSPCRWSWLGYPEIQTLATLAADDFSSQSYFNIFGAADLLNQVIRHSFFE